MLYKEGQWSSNTQLAALGGCSVLFVLMIEFLVATIINHQTPTDLFLSVEKPVKQQPLASPPQQINQKGVQLVKHFEGLTSLPTYALATKKQLGLVIQEKRLEREER